MIVCTVLYQTDYIELIGRVSMLRRELYTSGRVRQMQFDNRRKEDADKDSLQLVARDRLITAKMVSEERVENKR